MDKRSFTLEELAQLTKTRFVGDKSAKVSGINSLEEASETDVSFLANARYEESMKRSQAGIICIGPTTPLIPGKNFLISDHPSRVFQQLAELILAEKLATTGFEKIHPSALIHPSAVIGEGVSIGPFTVIDMNVVVESSTTIGAFVFIGAHTKVGKECTIHPGCIIRERCLIGNRVILQPGCVIGSCGFGYLPDEKGKFQKLQQLGIVVIEDDVEIGANTTIDRARFKETKICRGTKIDNLVQIAHNVIVGEDNAIAAQTGIAGSSKTGRNVVMGGQVGISGHVDIGDGASIGAQAGVSKTLPAHGKYRGCPAQPINDYHRQKILVKKLPALVKQIEALEKQIVMLQEEVRSLKK